VWFWTNSTKKKGFGITKKGAIMCDFTKNKPLKGASPLKKGLLGSYEIEEFSCKIILRDKNRVIFHK